MLRVRQETSVPVRWGADTYVCRAETHLGACRDSLHKGPDESRPGTLRGFATSVTWQTDTVISGRVLNGGDRPTL